MPAKKTRTKIPEGSRAVSTRSRAGTLKEALQVMEQAAPEKKEEKPTSGNSFWKGVYMDGVLLASLAAALSFHNDYLTWVLMVLGVMVGLFYFDSANLMNFGLLYLILVVPAPPLDKFPVVRHSIT